LPILPFDVGAFTEFALVIARDGEATSFP